MLGKGILGFEKIQPPPSSLICTFILPQPQGVLEIDVAANVCQISVRQSAVMLFWKYSSYHVFHLPNLLKLCLRLFFHF